MSDFLEILFKLLVIIFIISMIFGYLKTFDKACEDISIIRNNLKKNEKD